MIHSPVKERQIEGSKIRIKVLIDELLIDAEVVGVGCALGLDAGLQRDEVEPVRDVLTGAHQHVAGVLHVQDLQHIGHYYISFEKEQFIMSSPDDII